MSGQQQHVDIHRKLMLRRQLLRFASDGAAYVPFCGDGDIAASLYSDRTVYAADLDAQRVATCSSRIDGLSIVHDCDEWPFPGVAARFSIADFDAYAYPYDSFRAFWCCAEKRFPLVVFFTDGQRQAVKRATSFRLPDGSIVNKDGRRATSESRQCFNFWRLRYCEPWLRGYVSPGRVRLVRGYMRRDMFYWGAVIDDGR